VLKLISSPNSPYARKVRIALADKKIECETVDRAALEGENPVQAYNPLAKVPVLVLDDGTCLFDSRVIVEYLDSVSPVARLIPEPARQRIVVRRFEALADGVCDATSLVVNERRRPARMQNAEWIERQERKIVAGVQELSRDLGDKTWCNGEAYSLADIATGCALGYLDLRYPDLAWREQYENLARLVERLDKRPSFAETRPPPAR
jgi:glutathione S-transferase